MSFVTEVGMASGDEKFTSSAAKERALGTIGQTEDGRRFRWFKNGGTALTAGKLVQSAAANSSQDAALVVTAGVAVGAYTVPVTVQATVTRDQYKGGFLTVEGAPGVGMYKVAGNPAASSGATINITLAPNDPIIGTALSTASTVGLRSSPYSGVIVTPTTVTGAILGVTTCSVSANFYGWMQEGDFGFLHTDIAPAVNTSLMFGGTSAGNANARSSALNDVPEITVADSVDAGAGADAFNFVRLKLV